MQSYHEQLIHRANQPYITECPLQYAPLDDLIERTNAGEHIPEQEVLAAYFDSIEQNDPEYLDQVRKIVSRRKDMIAGEAGYPNRVMQIIVPAYREGVNAQTYLKEIEAQFDHNPDSRPLWGISFVFDHAVPFRNKWENTARKEMHAAIDELKSRRPDIAPYIDTIEYKRRRETEQPVLPVGLARKVGEDVIMLERLRLLDADDVETPPLYLTMMDVDTNELTPGTLDEMASLISLESVTQPTVVRVEGSFDSVWVRSNPQLHALQMMWEGAISAVGLNTRHNPFSIGRLSAFPAKEYAMTGGGFARRLNFPDEDIRHGIQVAWRLNDIKTVQTEGTYSTSSRREIHTVNGVRRLVNNNQGNFDMETLQCASLIRMYGGWAQEQFRDQAQLDGAEPLADYDTFLREVPPELLEAFANAFYRFTTFVMFVVDELALAEVPEVIQLKDQFLSGQIPYFEVELQTLNFLRRISDDNSRQAELFQYFERASNISRETIESILSRNGIKYTVDDTLLTGINEGDGDIFMQTDDRTQLARPFKIDPDLMDYFLHLRSQYLVD